MLHCHIYLIRNQILEWLSGLAVNIEYVVVACLVIQLECEGLNPIVTLCFSVLYNNRQSWLSCSGLHVDSL